MARLVVLKGAPSLGPFELGAVTSPVRIGRDTDCGVVIPNASVSRRHCEIARNGEGALVLRPLGARNGTDLNGKTLFVDHVLADRDLISVGDVVLRFEVNPAPTSLPEDRVSPAVPRGEASPIIPKRSDSETPPSDLLRIVCRHPTGRTEAFHLGPEPLTVGRAEENRVRLDDAKASLRHAVIEAIADGHLIRDLGSSNGTYVNAVQIGMPTRLELDALVQVGLSRLLYTKRPHLEWAVLFGDLPGAPPSLGAPPPAKPSAPPSAPPTAPPSKGGVLELSRDLTALARAGKLERVIGRKAEIRRLAQILGQKRKPNAILVGEAGVGKTGLVEGLAQKIAAGDCPASFATKRIVEISIAHLVSGTTYRGELEKKVEELLRDAEADPDVILFIDEIHMAVGAGKTSGSSVDVANLLKPVLARGRLRVIGATTTAEYHKHIASDPAFQRRFEILWVDEPTRDEALEILRSLRPDYEKHHNVTIDDSALVAAVDFSLRYLKDRKLPDKALDLIDQACTRTTIGTFRFVAPIPDKPLSSLVDRATIAQVVSDRCQIPVQRLLETEVKKLESAGDFLARRVVGQPEAIEAVTRALLTAQAGLKDPRRPTAAFLFAGPSGTGKTELAKALAEHLFQDTDRLVHLDMSEYAERHAVSRLYGSPPGYVGSDDEGQLTGAIRRHPLSVVLFDEIEKAHPDVLNVLLQILDEGRLTDGKGRRADFRESVVILSTNLGSDTASAARGHLGFAPEGAPGERTPEDDARRESVYAAIDGFLRPEIVNRLTARIVFAPLSVESLEKIVELSVAAVERRLSARKVTLVLADEARRDLAERAHEPRFGAREVERFVQREVADPLAAALVDGRIASGARVDVRLRDGKIVVEARGS